MAPREPWPRYTRNLSGAWLAIDDIRAVLDDMRMSDEIAAAVTARLREEAKQGTLPEVNVKPTFAQKWGTFIGAGAMAAIIVADTIYGFIK